MLKYALHEQDALIYVTPFLKSMNVVESPKKILKKDYYIEMIKINPP